MDNSPTSCKAIFTFQDFSQAVDLPDLLLQVTLGDARKMIQLPITEAILIETKNLQQNSAIHFQLEQAKGELVGYSEFKIPSHVFGSHETEICQALSFQLAKGSRTSFTTEFSAIFLIKEPKEREGGSRLSSVQSLGNLLPKKSSQNSANSTPQKKRTSEASSPSLRKPNNDYEALDHLIRLNKNENNLPLSFLEDSVFDVDKPESVRLPIERTSSTGPWRGSNSTANSPKKSNSKTVKRQGSSKKEKEKSSSPFAKAKHEFSLYDSVQKLGGDSIEMPQQPQQHGPLRKSQTMPSSALELNGGFDLSDEKQIPEVFEYLENKAGEKGFPRALIEYLKNHMIAMDFRISEMGSVRQENEKLRGELKNAEEAKKFVEQQRVASVNSLTQENIKLKDQIALLLDRNQELANMNKDMQTEFFFVRETDYLTSIRNIKIKEMADQTSMKLNKKSNELAEVHLKVSELSEVKFQLKRAYESLNRVEVERGEDQKNFQESLKSLKRALEETRLMLEKVYEEKRNLVLQLTNEKLAHQDSRNELLVMQRNLENAEAYQNVVKSLEVQRDELLRQLAESRVDRDEVFRLLEKAQMHLSMKVKEYEIKEEEYLSKITDFEEIIKEYELQCSRYAREIDAFKIKVSDATLKQAEFEQQLTSKKQLEQEKEQLKARLEQAIEDKDMISKGVEALTENHDIMNNRAYVLEKANDELIQVITGKDEEINNLRDAITELIEQLHAADGGPKYVPAKGDAVDNALADYLNSNKDAAKYRVLFIRESEGVYQFGSKKIYIKIEGDKVLIRVGGGYMTIRELLENVAPAEYEKLTKYNKNNDDEAARIVAKNIVLNKVIAGRCIHSIEKSKTTAYRVNNSRAGGDSPAHYKADVKDYSSSPKNFKGLF